MATPPETAAPREGLGEAAATTVGAAEGERVGEAAGDAAGDAVFPAPGTGDGVARAPRVGDAVSGEGRPGVGDAFSVGVAGTGDRVGDGAALVTSSAEGVTEGAAALWPS